MCGNIQRVWDEHAAQRELCGSLLAEQQNSRCEARLLEANSRSMRACQVHRQCHVVMPMQGTSGDKLGWAAAVHTAPHKKQQQRTCGGVVVLNTGQHSLLHSPIALTACLQVALPALIAICGRPG